MFWHRAVHDYYSPPSNVMSTYCDENKCQACPKLRKLQSGKFAPWGRILSVARRKSSRQFPHNAVTSGIFHRLDRTLRSELFALMLCAQHNAVQTLTHSKLSDKPLNSGAAACPPNFAPLVDIPRHSPCLDRWSRPCSVQDVKIDHPSHFYYVHCSHWQSPTHASLQRKHVFVKELLARASSLQEASAFIVFRATDI